MQKVSKQSLAMIALSILLAISIALTFTFAALQVKKTATGTITFSGNYAISMTGTDNDELTDAWTFKGTIVPTGAITLNGTPTVKFTNIAKNASMSYGVKITISGASAGAITGAFTEGNGKINTSTDAEVSVALSSLIQNATIDWSKVNQTASEYTALTFNVQFIVDSTVANPTFGA